jgi:hypothetical protein
MWLIQKSGSTRISQPGAGMGKATSCWRGAYSAHLVEGVFFPLYSGKESRVYRKPVDV